MTDYPPPPPPSAPQPPMPGAGGNESKNNLGTIALVLGILGIVCCSIFTAIPAIIVGKKSQQAAAQGLATNGQLGKVGVLLGWIGLALFVVSVIGYSILIATGNWQWEVNGF